MESEHSNLVQQQEVEAQQDLTESVSSDTKKRKEIDARSKAWEHFERIKDEKGVTIKGRCIYCGKKLNAHTKFHGTSSLRNHILTCKKMPHSKDKRQSLLTLLPDVVEAPGSETVGVLGSWKFDQDLIRKKLSEMVIVDELPFKFVEREGFQKLMYACCPRFKIPSRWTISRDIYNIFLSERLKLKTFLKDKCQRVCLTTDSWTSIQRLNYMCITAHFIDNEWKLHKKILSFVPLTSHRGEYIAKAIENCLLDWGLKNVFTVTVDNASSNDTALSYFRKKMLSWGTSSVRAKYLHVRCIAHILNLIVQDGLKDVHVSVKKVRESVRYIRNSPARLRKFKELSELVGVEHKSSLSLDVPTRWNSTYEMLKRAALYEKVFDKYDETESAFRADLGEDVPDIFDWHYVNSMVVYLQQFNDMTLRISGSLYVTSNTLFSEISDLFCVLRDWIESDDASLNAMGINMKAKFDKYFGDLDKINFIIFFAYILDPTNKVEYLGFSLSQMYGEGGSRFYDLIMSSLVQFFEDYKAFYCPVVESGSDVLSQSVVSGISQCLTSNPPVQSAAGKPLSVLKAKYKQYKIETGLGGCKQSELDIYLNEAIVEEDGIDVLRWWKLNSERFPVLSRMARDVLAVPISTVASESAFSTGGRVLDSFRSSLTPKLVEALICSQDWLRQSNKPISVEESIDDVDNLEKGQ